MVLHRHLSDCSLLFRIIANYGQYIRTRSSTLKLQGITMKLTLFRYYSAKPFVDLFLNLSLWSVTLLGYLVYRSSCFESMTLPAVIDCAIVWTLVNIFSVIKTLLPTHASSLTQLS